MSLIDFAKREFAVVGYAPPEALPEDDINRWIQENVLELLAVLAKQGHSGVSAGECIKLFTQLASYKPISPLTGADDEWRDVSEYGPDPVWQNIRDSRIFKYADGTIMQIGMIIWEEPDGSYYTNRHSAIAVEGFPYVSPPVVVRPSSEDPSNQHDNQS